VIPVETVQIAKLLAVFLIFACVFAEAAMEINRRRWSRLRFSGLCLVTFCCGFLISALVF